MSGIFNESGSAKTDRGNQLAATQQDWNVFAQGMGAGTAGETAGTSTLSTAVSTLGPAQDYYKSLLQGGRTQTAQNAAPAIQAAQAQTTAQRNAQGTAGTQRQGGTAAANQTAGTAQNANIDSIINQNLTTGKATGAAGLSQVSAAQAGIGSTQLQNAMAELGMGSSAVNDILKNATESRMNSAQIQSQMGAGFGELLAAFM